MSLYQFQTGQRVRAGTAFTHAELQYPANWLQFSTAADRDALGLTEIIEQPRPDERYYWVSEDPAVPGAWIATPKNLDGKKAELVRQVKATAAATLSPSDWYVVRAAERQDKPVPADVSTYRAAVRAASDAIEAQILKAANIPALQAVDIGNAWPVAPWDKVRELPPAA